MTGISNQRLAPPAVMPKMNTKPSKKTAAA
jgi:hypothetical protein